MADLTSATVEELYDEIDRRITEHRWSEQDPAIQQNLRYSRSRLSLDQRLTRG